MVRSLAPHHEQPGGGGLSVPAHRAWGYFRWVGGVMLLTVVTVDNILTKPRPPHRYEVSKTKGPNVPSHTRGYRPAYPPAILMGNGRGWGYRPTRSTITTRSRTMTLEHLDAGRRPASMTLEHLRAAWRTAPANPSPASQDRAPRP